MEREPIYVGIDVAKAQVDVAVRPKGHRWIVSYEEARILELVSQVEDLNPAMVLGGHRRFGTAIGRCPGSYFVACGRSQPASGPGLRQGYREAGQDRFD